MAAAVLVAVTWPRDTHHAGAESASGCTNQELLHVLAAPAIAPAITRVADDWRAAHPAIHSICVGVSVTPQDSRAAEQSLLTASTATVWIPDSTIWSSRLAADAPSLAGQITVGHSVANSPLVVATSPARAAAVAASAKAGWRGVLTGSTPITLPDPTETSDGALALLALQSQLGPSATATDTLGSVFLHLAEQVMPSAAAGFADLKDYPTTAPAFVASEQEVIAANKASTTPIATAVYPSNTKSALDFPLVTINPSRVLVYAEALSQFEQQLSTPAAAVALNAVNLRDADAAPLKDAAASGAGSEPVPLAPATTAATVTSVLRRWVSAGAPNQFLAVIDVSGSMRDDSGNGQSKIQVASDAAQTAITLMPDSWSVGLWTFSLNPPPAKAWTEQVPLGTVRSDRSALLGAARNMPNEVVGDTGLYTTALAAFQEVSSHYARNEVNSVVLMTDGSDTDTSGINLPTLIRRLKAAVNPKRPVSITSIALGKDADVNALKQISAATGGHTYIVRKASDISTVFVQVTLGKA